MATRRPQRTPRLVEAVTSSRAPRGARRGKRGGGGGARRVLLWLVGLTLVGAICAAALGAGLVLYYGSDPNLPKPEQMLQSITTYQPKVTTRVLDRTGQFVLGEIFEERRTVVPIDKIPDIMIHALVDAEDAQFFEHKGLNYWGMLRAVIYNLRPGAHLQGASTLTQQLVKTYLLKTNERTLKRKVQEAILSYRLEDKVSKKEILYLYLNQIYFGHQRYGIEEAAQFYFGKHVWEIDAGEAAVLASLPKGPELISPLRHPKRAKSRQLYVLSQMQRYGHVTPEQAKKFGDAPIQVVRPPEPLAPEFVDEARRQLVERYGEDKLPTLGGEVVTTCDLEVQRAARAALEKRLEELDARQGYRKPLAHLKQTSEAQIADALDERAVHHLRSLIGDTPTKAQRGRWLGDRAKALDAGKVTEAVVVEVRTDPKDYGLVVDTGHERGFLKVPAPGGGEDKRHDRYNPAGAPIEKRFAVGDVLAVRAEPSLGRHPAPTSAPSQKPARGGKPPAAKGEAEGEGEGDEGDEGAADGWPLVVPEFGPQGAVVVLDPNTREVRAMVGGYGFHAGGFNRVLQAKRQPGSAFKPFLYATALAADPCLPAVAGDAPSAPTGEGAGDADGGAPPTYDPGNRRCTPATVMNDSPQIFALPGIKEWKVRNAESHEFQGPVRLRRALARSLNTVAAQIMCDLGGGQFADPPCGGGRGAEGVARLAAAAGIGSKLEENLSLALGSSVVSPLELTNAYATFATLGRAGSPRFVTRLGPTRESEPAAPLTQAIPTDVAWLTTSMMQSVIDEGTAASARGRLHRPAAGKTGTTTSERDAWFVGFTPDLVCGVWVGFDDMRDLGHGEQGARSALPVWVDVMVKALDRVPPTGWPQPPTIEVRHIDAATGLLAAPGAPGIDEYFLAGTAPTRTALPSGSENPDTFLLDQP